MRRFLAVFTLHSLAVQAQTPPANPASARKPEAVEAMKAGEAAFLLKKYDEAIRQYRAAVGIDPAFYEAALFVGEAFVALKQLDSALVAYRQAIGINPNRETAYRYIGDAYLGANQDSAARVWAIEAMVAEPYNPFSRQGIQRWQAKMKRPLKPLRITAPPTREAIVSDTAVWLAYLGVRDAWKPDSSGVSKKFLAAYPNESGARGEKISYRNSLAEEREAFEALIVALGHKLDMPLPKYDEYPLAELVQLQQQGLVEAWILFQRSGPGISKDYVPYRDAPGNRQKLIRYWNWMLDKT